MKLFSSLLLLLALSPTVSAQSTFGELPEGNAQACTVDTDCPVINCVMAPCPGAVCVDGACQVESNPPNPECVQDADCPEIQCLVAPCDVPVCNAGLCELTASEDNLITEGGLPEPVTNGRQEMSRDECTSEGGSIVGDIGNGAIHRPDYVCESNGQAPIGTIVPGAGEPSATEGEVCCGPPALNGVSREECTNSYNGVVVGDIGNGAIHAPDYLCESNGEPPIAKVVPGEGEPIAMEGEVCCGPKNMTSIDTETVTTVTDEDATPAPTPKEEETTSGAGSAFQSFLAAIVLAAAVFLQTFVDFFIEDAEELFANNPVLLYQRSTSM